MVWDKLQTIIDLGVVEESQSDWHSVIVLVCKPDNSIPFCIDFWKVNAVMKFNTYPILQVDELLECLGLPNVSAPQTL